MYRTDSVIGDGTSRFFPKPNVTITIDVEEFSVGCHG